MESPPFCAFLRVWLVGAGFRGPETRPPGLASRRFSALPGNCPAGQGQGIAPGVRRKEGQ